MVGPKLAPSAITTAAGDPGSDLPDFIDDDLVSRPGPRLRCLFEAYGKLLAHLLNSFFSVGHDLGNALREKWRKVASGLKFVSGETVAAEVSSPPWVGSVCAAGNRMHVRVIQFIKGTWKTGEVDAAKALAPHLEIVRAGRGFTIERLRDPRIANDEHVVAAQSGMVEAREAITSPSFDVVVPSMWYPGAINAPNSSRSER